VITSYFHGRVCFVDFLQLKKDKVELENQLEQEQEALVNRLWKRMDKLEAEKRCCFRCSVITLALSPHL